MVLCCSQGKSAVHSLYVVKTRPLGTFLGISKIKKKAIKHINYLVSINFVKRMDMLIYSMKNQTKTSPEKCK